MPICILLKKYKKLEEEKQGSRIKSTKGFCEQNQTNYYLKYSSISAPINFPSIKKPSWP